MAGQNGGARPGAGRKPEPPQINENPALETTDPVAFLEACMADKTVCMRIRQDSAKQLLALRKVPRKAAALTGKKGEQREAAEKVAEIGNRFAPMPPPPPRLRAVK